MQGREDEVAGLSRCQGCLDRLTVTHFADQDDIRVFTEDGAKAVRVCPCILADFSLVNQAHIRLVNVLHRILQRDNMLFSRMVDLVQDRGQGR